MMVSTIREQINTRRLKLTLTFIFGFSGAGFFFSESLENLLVSLFLLTLACVGIASEVAEWLSSVGSFFYTSPTVSALSQLAVADAALAKDNWEYALQAYLTHAERTPEDQDVRFQIAQLYHHKLHDKDSAYPWYDSVLKYQKGNTLEAMSFLSKIQISCENGLVERALALCQRMAERFPSHTCTKAAKELVNTYASTPLALLEPAPVLVAAESKQPVSSP